MIRRALLALSEPRALLSLAAAAVLLIVAAFSLPATAKESSPAVAFRSIDSGIYVGGDWTCLLSQGDEPIAGGSGPVLTIACHGPQGLRAGKVWGGCPQAGTGQPWGLSPLGQYAPDTAFELVSIAASPRITVRLGGELIEMARIASIAPPDPNLCGFSLIRAREA